MTLYAIQHTPYVREFLESDATLEEMQERFKGVIEVRLVDGCTCGH